jgi:hypothetical protein
MIDVVQICEIGMMLAFGFSWPFNIVKSWKSKTAKGKSLMFECVVIFGYLIGIYGKYITYRNTGVIPYPTWFYILDIAMVAIDLVLTLRNRAYDSMEMHKIRKEVRKSQQERMAAPAEETVAVAEAAPVQEETEE